MSHELCAMTLSKAVLGSKKKVATLALEFTARIDAGLMNGLPGEVCQMYARMLEADLTGTWAPAETIAAREFAIHEPGSRVPRLREGSEAGFVPVPRFRDGVSLENVKLKREEQEGERVTRLTFVVRLTGEEAREAARWAARHGCKAVELQLKNVAAAAAAGGE